MHNTRTRLRQIEAQSEARRLRAAIAAAVVAGIAFGSVGYGVGVNAGMKQQLSLDAERGVIRVQGHEAANVVWDANCELYNDEKAGDENGHVFDYAVCEKPLR